VVATGTEGRVIFHTPHRAPVTARLTVAALALTWLVAGTAWSADRPIVLVHPDRIVPARLQVHLGELVTWQAPSGGVLRLELDRHPSSHEVVVRSGRVVAYFRKPGEHWYLVSLEAGGRRKQLRGVVTVSEKSAQEPSIACSPESSNRICVEP
jgi:hypothetical protein